jgi:hypothetical protein
MAQVQTAPFLLVRRSEPPPAEVSHQRRRSNACRAVFALVMTSLCALLAYEVSVANDTGAAIALPLPLR